MRQFWTMYNTNNYKGTSIWPYVTDYIIMINRTERSNSTSHIRANNEEEWIATPIRERQRHLKREDRENCRGKIQIKALGTGRCNAHITTLNNIMINFTANLWSHIPNIWMQYIPVNALQKYISNELILESYFNYRMAWQKVAQNAIRTWIKISYLYRENDLNAPKQEYQSTQLIE